MNKDLFLKLKKLRDSEEFSKLREVHNDYIKSRSRSYMANETGHDTSSFEELIESSEIGYAELALDLIESLQGGRTSRLILNIPNHDSITGMAYTDIVEIPAYVSKNSVLPISIGIVPDHCLGLMKQIKAFEKLTIDAAFERSFNKSVVALTVHPLVADFKLAKKIVEQYIKQHGDYFPKLV